MDRPTAMLPPEKRRRASHSKRFAGQHLRVFRKIRDGEDAIPTVRGPTLHAALRLAKAQSFWMALRLRT
jgi:hypothetical protein